MSVNLSFTIPGKEAPEFKKMLRQKATEKGMSMSELIVEAVAEYLRNNK